MKNNIINDSYSDYHIHSMFSDGCATIEEIVQFAWKIWMKEIAITDHSDHLVKVLEERYWICPSGGARYALNNRKNVHNNVNVIFWVEWDILNENWDICITNQQIEWKFTILSVHRNWYLSEPSTATKWLLNAIEKYHDKINLIWHPYDTKELWEFIKIEPVVELANKYWIAIEFNQWTFDKKNYIEDKLLYVLKNTKKIYVNSDAHNLARMKQLRKSCYDFLENL